MKKVFFLSVIIVFLIGCAGTQKKDSGVYIKADRVYINTQVDISFKVPRGWEKAEIKGYDIAFIDTKENSAYETSILSVMISEPLCDNTEEELKHLITILPKGFIKSEMEKEYKKQKMKLKSFNYKLHKIAGDLPGLLYSGKIVTEVEAVDWGYGYHWYTDRTSRFKMYITPCYDKNKLCYILFSVDMPDPKLYLSYRYDLKKIIDSFLAHYKQLKD